MEKKKLNLPPKEYNEKRKSRFLPIAPSKKKIQLKYIRLIILSILLPMLIMGAGFYIVFHQVLINAQLGRYAENQLPNVFFWLNLSLVTVIMLSIMVAGWFALYLSHRIAGPLYRIEDEIRKIINNGPFEIKIRKKDELQELVILINELASKKSK